MRLQGLRHEAHAHTYPSSCASERDHYKVQKHTAIDVSSRISRE